MGLFRRHRRHDRAAEGAHGRSADGGPAAPGAAPDRTAPDWTAPAGTAPAGTASPGAAGDRTDGGGTPDASFPFLTRGEAGRLRAAVHAAFAERGLEVTVHADHVESADGVRFGLHNLAAACHATPGGESAWRASVAAHVDAVLRSTSVPDALERGDREAVLRDVVLRVMGASTLPDVDWLEYARPLGGDLVEVLALDLPETVHLLGDADVARFGEADLRAAGLANLLAQPYDAHDHLYLEGGGDVHVVSGESVYVASRLLVLPDLLRRTVGEGEAVPTPHGLLVSAATRHQLAFHVIRDSGVVPALQALVPTTAQEYAAGVGAVSPFVFWWHDGRFQQVSAVGEDGLRLEVTPEFARMLEAVLPVS